MATINETSFFAPILASTGDEVSLDLQELYLTGLLLPIGARLNVLHRFRSSEAEPIEIIYTFALPRDAALIKFLVKGDGFTAHSELHLVEDAEKKYEEGIEKGSLSVMTRNYRDGKVNLMVGNVRPGEEVAVALDIISGVETNDNGFNFKFPFTLSPVYHAKAKSTEIEPGVGRQMLPEKIFGDLILPPFAKDASNLHRIGFRLDLDKSNEISEIASPSHTVKFSLGRNGENPFVTLANDTALPDSDLSLNIKTCQKKTMIFMSMDQDCKKSGHFISLIPSSAFGKFNRQQQRIVFVIDRSGSMEGRKLEQVKKVVLECLKTLGEEDKFTIMAFDDSLQLFKDNLISASSDLVAEAKKFVENISSKGGTEITSALMKASSMFSDGEHGDIFILTDGEIGETEKLIQQVKSLDIKIHTLGIGNVSQERFLTSLARETGGTCHFATAEDKITDVALEQFSSISSPVATEVTAKIKKDTAGRIDPKPANSVFNNIPLIIFGEINKPGAEVLLIDYKESEKMLEIPLKVVDEKHSDTIKFLHGARLITDLESVYTSASSYDSSPEEKLKIKRIEKRLEQLSKKYTLASRRMSLVAVVERENDEDGLIPKTKIVKVGMPLNTSFDSYFEEDQDIIAVGCLPIEIQTGSFFSMDLVDLPYIKKSFFTEVDDSDINEDIYVAEILIKCGLLDKAIKKALETLNIKPDSQGLHHLLTMLYREKQDIPNLAYETLRFTKVSKLNNETNTKGEVIVKTELDNIETYIEYLKNHQSTAEYSELKKIIELLLTILISIIEEPSLFKEQEYVKEIPKIIQPLESIALPLVLKNEEKIGKYLEVFLVTIKKDPLSYRQISKEIQITPAITDNFEVDGINISNNLYIFGEKTIWDRLTEYAESIKK